MLRLFQTLQCTALSVALPQAPTSKWLKIYLAEGVPCSDFESGTGSDVWMKSCDALSLPSKSLCAEVSSRADCATSALLLVSLQAASLSSYRTIQFRGLVLMWQARV